MALWRGLSQVIPQALIKAIKNCYSSLIFIQAELALGTISNVMWLCERPGKKMQYKAVYWWYLYFYIWGDFMEKTTKALWPQVYIQTIFYEHLYKN